VADVPFKVNNEHASLSQTRWVSVGVPRALAVDVGSSGVIGSRCQTAAGGKGFLLVDDGVNHRWYGVLDEWASGTTSDTLEPDSSEADYEYELHPGAGTSECGNEIFYSQRIFPRATIRDAGGKRHWFEPRNTAVMGAKGTVNPGIWELEQGRAGRNHHSYRAPQPGLELPISTLSSDGSIHRRLYFPNHQRGFGMSLDFYIDLYTNQSVLGGTYGAIAHWWAGFSWWKHEDRWKWNATDITIWFPSEVYCPLATKEGYTVTVTGGGNNEYNTSITLDLTSDLATGASQGGTFAGYIPPMEIIPFYGEMFLREPGNVVAAEETAFARAKAGRCLGKTTAAAWDGYFGTHGKVPEVPADTSNAAIDLSASGRMWDTRPGGGQGPCMNLLTSDAASQGGQGATHYGPLLHDYITQDQHTYAMHDWLLRAFHWRNSDGTMFSEARHPKVFCDEMDLNSRNGSYWLGRVPGGSAWGGGDRIPRPDVRNGLDNTHYCASALANNYIITRNPLFYQGMWGMTRIFQSWIQFVRGIPAHRGSGRPLNTMAHFAHAHPHHKPPIPKYLAPTTPSAKNYYSQLIANYRGGKHNNAVKILTGAIGYPTNAINGTKSGVMTVVGLGPSYVGSNDAPSGQPTGWYVNITGWTKQGTSVDATVDETIASGLIGFKSPRSVIGEVSNVSAGLQAALYGTNNVWAEGLYTIIDANTIRLPVDIGAESPIGGRLQMQPPVFQVVFNLLAAGYIWAFGNEMGHQGWKDVGMEIMESLITNNTYVTAGGDHKIPYGCFYHRPDDPVWPAAEGTAIPEADRTEGAALARKIAFNNWNKWASGALILARDNSSDSTVQDMLAEWGGGQFPDWELSHFGATGPLVG
jgi:hypothetical protein